MSDESKQAEPVEPKGAERQETDLVPRSELQKAIDKRQSAKKELESERQEAAKLRAQLDEFNAAKVASEEDALRQQGENEKIIATRDEALKSVTAELEQMKWGQRFNTTVQAVTTASGLDAAVVEGLLLREKQVRGTDVAPEELSDDSVAEFIDAMRASAPSLFQAQNVGGTPGVASPNGGVSEIAALAQRMGARNQRKQN